ncbi:putative lipoprotein [hydrocarbon metagenome]|uniref:Putative lipoprotein n=1 Tax=hydrocarbon metagenome TaxID=938273 RepID=A0A0W8FUX9_9ZZZZ
MFKKLRKIAKTKTAGIVLYWIARLYCATLRVKIENESEWSRYLEQGGKVLLCLWHQQFLVSVVFFPKYKKYQPSVMASRSKDGDISSRILAAGGVTPVRGSSSRGGIAALREMIRRINQYRLGAHVLDGPQGPAGVVKLGALAIAAETNAVMVPSVIIADRAWYLRSWDRFMIPKPFSRVTIKFFPKIELPPIMDKDEYEKQRKKLEEIMRPYLHP